jgi:hypothetical protein
MSDKTTKTRVKETLTYIRGYSASGLPSPIRNDIATMVLARLPRTNATELARYDAVSTEMSVKANLDPTQSSGSDHKRSRRRAIVLLWRAMGATQPVPGDVDDRVMRGMTLAPGALAAELTRTMLLAATVASNAGAAHVFNMAFLGNPLGFLSQHRIIIMGSTIGAATFTAPSASYRNPVQFYFQYDAGKDRFELKENSTPMHGGFHQFQAASVPALHWSMVPGRGNVVTPTSINPAGYQGMLGAEMEGAEYMVTAQFTGCSFCYSTHGATMYAAHIAPTADARPAIDGNTLANQIMGQRQYVARGEFANFVMGGPMSVFGNGAGNALVLDGNPFYPAKALFDTPGQMKWTSIFGRRLNGAWQLYTQSVDGALVIMEHRRIA